MFMAADIVVKAVMVGLVLASVLTWTIWFAKAIELMTARRRMRAEIVSIAQVRTWNGFVQWTTRSGLFIRPGGGVGWHRYASYTPFPESGPPQRYLPHESSEMGLIFTLAAGKEFRRSSRVGVAIEGFFVASSGEDSSGHRTVIGVNVVPLFRW